MILPRLLIAAIAASLSRNAESTSWDYAQSPSLKGMTCGHGTAGAGNVRRCPQNLWQKGEGFAHCSGQEQSPVNLVADPLPYPQAIALTLESKGCHAAHFQVNQHTAQVVYPEACQHSFIASWSGKTYYLEQFNYHAPSEHTVDGKYFAMEAHHLHKSKTGEVLVLAVFMTIDKSVSRQECAEMAAKSVYSEECTRARFFDHVLTFGKGTHQAALAQVNILQAFNTYSVEHVTKATVDNDVYRNFIPPIAGYVFHYMGSLTAPPCTEGVTWILHPKPVKIFEESLVAYRKIVNAIPDNQLAARTMPDFIHPIGQWNVNERTNNRDIQPLGPRKIYKVSTEVAAHTSLVQSSQIGATVLEVAHTRGFKLGHEIIISRGHSVEKRMIISIGVLSLTLDKSMDFIHPQDTPVTMPWSKSTWDYAISPHRETSCGGSTVDRCGQNIWKLGPGNEACAGTTKDQSPVNAIFSNPVPYPQTVHFKLVSEPCEGAQFVLNENTLEVRFHAVCLHKSAAVWKHKSFYMHQFHYHSPSEHTADGSYYVMEAQHVHKAPDGEYLILAVFMTLNPQVSAANCAANPSDECTRAQFFDKILSFGQSSQEAALAFFNSRKTERHIHVNVPATLVENDAYSKFIPPVTDGFVYHYMGSFTAPPCTVGVTWILHPQIVGIFSTSLTTYRTAVSILQSNQLAQQLKPPHFVDYIGNWDTKLGTNNREIQDLGSRSFFKAPVDMQRPIPVVDGTSTTPPLTTTPGFGHGSNSAHGSMHHIHDSSHVKLYGVMSASGTKRIPSIVWLGTGIILGWTSLTVADRLRARFRIPIISETLSARNIAAAHHCVDDDEGDDRETAMITADTE